MHDAKPVLTLLVLCGGGLLWLGLSWLGMSANGREHRLTQIARAEAAATGPPARLAPQARWLFAHRLSRLQGLSLLLGLSALMGIGEGLWRRQYDRLAGMRLRSWTLGVLSLALAVGVLCGLVLLPFSWSVSVVASVGVGWSALTGYLLSKGVPYVA